MTVNTATSTAPYQHQLPDALWEDDDVSRVPPLSEAPKESAPEAPEKSTGIAAVKTVRLNPLFDPRLPPASRSLSNAPFAWEIRTCDLLLERMQKMCLRCVHCAERVRDIGKQIDEIRSRWLYSKEASQYCGGETLGEFPENQLEEFNANKQHLQQRLSKYDSILDTGWRLCFSPMLRETDCQTE